MNIKVLKDYEELSQTASSYIEHQVKKNPQSVLGLATGGTPLGTYKQVVQSYQSQGIDYSGVSSLNLDEYVGLDKNDPQSYHYFMKEHLFDHINIQDEHTFIPNGKTESLFEECKRYEGIIDEIGPPDLQILGIGENGHIGFNEPDTSFESMTHIVDLEVSTRQANARFFNSFDDVPKQAITMGIGSILKSKQIILLASGERKAEAIKRLLQGPVDEQFPASALHHHNQVTLLVDQASYQLIEKE